MSALAALLKLAKRRVDSLGLEVARVKERIATLRAHAADISASEANEIALAATDPALASFMPAYRVRMRREASDTQTSIEEAEATLALVREQLSVAYREKSKFEQLIEQEELRQEKVRADLEQKVLDEVAVTRAGRG